MINEENNPNSVDFNDISIYTKSLIIIGLAEIFLGTRLLKMDVFLNLVPVIQKFQAKIDRFVISRFYFFLLVKLVQGLTSGGEVEQKGAEGARKGSENAKNRRKISFAKNRKKSENDENLSDLEGIEGNWELLSIQDWLDKHYSKFYNLSKINRKFFETNLKLKSKDSVSTISIALVVQAKNQGYSESDKTLALYYYWSCVFFDTLGWILAKIRVFLGKGGSEMTLRNIDYASIQLKSGADELKSDLPENSKNYQINSSRALRRTVLSPKGSAGGSIVSKLSPRTKKSINSDLREDESERSDRVILDRKMERMRRREELRKKKQLIIDAIDNFSQGVYIGPKQYEMSILRTFLAQIDSGVAALLFQCLKITKKQMFLIQNIKLQKLGHRLEIASREGFSDSERSKDYSIRVTSHRQFTKNLQIDQILKKVKKTKKERKKSKSLFSGIFNWKPIMFYFI